ncbi:MAG: type II toxin-antitoxin system Phd/YefM family antitoxin [Spirochaetia bacterium]|nr:type II toxin-antitoxin system Phd/YefM family antitoxin [Spirochaetia bacterium]
MLLETNKMIPVKKLQKELTKKVREVSKTGEALYILKNNNMEAVMLSFEEYEHLHNLEEMFEQMEIKTVIEERLSTYNASYNKEWEEIREEV